jgi:acyl carrier protein
MDDFLKNLADAINAPDADLQPEQNLQDLPNWDSLAILTTISMLDLDYGVTVTGTDLQACTTVADVFALTSKDA